MPTSVRLENDTWVDVVVGRVQTGASGLVPVWLGHQRLGLLCQVQNNDRFGWTVVVAGDVQGLRLVAGFKQRWQAIQYAINVRTDLNTDRVRDQ